MYVCETSFHAGFRGGRLNMQLFTKYLPITIIHHSGVTRMIFINEWTELANLAFGGRLFHSFAPI